MPGKIKPQQTIAVSAANSRFDDAVKKWVSDWRTRKEIEKQRALSELTLLLKKDAVAP
jgi:hypothetical protein